MLKTSLILACAVAVPLASQQAQQPIVLHAARLLQVDNGTILQPGEILVEGESRTNPNRFQGRTRTNRLVLIDANERWRGRLLPVRLTESTGFTYYAEPVLLL